MNFPQTNLNADGRISVREKISYGFGDVACNVVFALTMSLSTYFYTDVVGMSAALVGTILLLSRIFDGISDVIVGILVDRTKSRFGKARAWVLWMTVPYGVSAVLLFMVPAHATTVVQGIYVFITYNLAVTFVYTALNLPYGTLAAMMTRNQNERAIINIFRMGMATVGNMIRCHAALYQPHGRRPEGMDHRYDHLFADRNGHAADLLLRLQGARPYPCNAAEHKNPAQDRLQVHDRQQILVADHRYVLLLGDVCHPERHHAHLLLQV